MLVFAIESTLSNGVGGMVLFANEVSAIFMSNENLLSVRYRSVRDLDG